MVSAPAFADDEWYAALEETIVETGNVQKAVETASEAGAEPEQLYLAVSSILDDLDDFNQSEDEEVSWDDICYSMHCCDGSVTGECPYGFWQACTSGGYCPAHE